MLKYYFRLPVATRNVFTFAASEESARRCGLGRYPFDFGKGNNVPLTTAVGPASLPGFSHRRESVNGVSLHYVIGGQGTPLLLWHGFCETWYCWRKVMPELAKKYTVIAPDMRGYGDSDKPATGYDGHTLAADFRGLVRRLGLGSIFIAAHDMGAPAALLYAAEYPAEVRALAYLEEPVLTKEVMQEIHAFNPHAARFGLLWWWKLALARDVPELLLTGKEREFLTSFYRYGTFDPSSVEEGAVQEYLRTFHGEEGIRGAFGVYRAIFETIDQTEVYKDPAKKIKTPLLGLGGSKSKADEVRQQLEQVAVHVQGGPIENCGHFMPDERPEVLIERLTSFFSGVSR
jgi:pimeloyl-ACP methyl ester carboxylesterase